MARGIHALDWRAKSRSQILINRAQNLEQSHPRSSLRIAVTPSYFHNEQARNNRIALNFAIVQNRRIYMNKAPRRRDL